MLLEGPYLLIYLNSCWVWIQAAAIILLFIILSLIITGYSLLFHLSLSREQATAVCSCTKEATISFE